MTQEQNGGYVPSQLPPGEQAASGPVRQAQPMGTAYPPHSPYPAYPPPWMTGPAPARRGRGWIVVLVTLLISSVGLNVLMLGMWFVTVGQTLGGGAVYQTEVLQEGPADKVVAVVPVVDLIDGNVAGWLDRVLDDLGDDESVAAVVLNVDSPGGTVAASDQINHRVRAFREQTGKPVIVSQGGYATSGGYYVSVAGEHIVAEPTTWTGNIGVILTTFVARKGLEDKLGVQPDVIISSHTPYKDVPSLFRDMKPDEQQYLRDLVEHAYQRFVDAVVEGRPNLAKLDREDVYKVANGKVYTAQQAKDLGLVDQIGYLEDAWRYAGERIGVKSPRVVLYRPRSIGLAGILLGSAQAPALEGRAEDPIRLAERSLTPRLMYLYHGGGTPGGGSGVRYPAQP